MIKITTQVEIGEIHFYNIFECLLFKFIFDFENYKIWKFL